MAGKLSGPPLPQMREQHICYVCGNVGHISTYCLNKNNTQQGWMISPAAEEVNTFLQQHVLETPDPNAISDFDTQA